MIFILEGPDLGGKTLIGERLTKLSGMRVYHAGGPPKDEAELKYRVRNLPYHKKILDRHPCISEQVYRPISGELPFIPVREMDDWIRQAQPIIIYCNPGLSHLSSVQHLLKEKAHKPQKHVDEVKENHKRIYYRYEGVMWKLKSITPVYPIDFRDATDKELKNIINIGGING